MSSQEDIKRKAPTRVQIDYTVETNGEAPILELPFVVGVMADLSGKTPREFDYKKRKFTEIDRESFKNVMGRIAPSVALLVPNRLTDKPDEEMNVKLEFNQMSDFDPGEVAKRIPDLNKLLVMRQQLKELLEKLDGNTELEKRLKEVLNPDDGRSKLEAVGAAVAPPADAAPPA